MLRVNDVVDQQAQTVRLGRRPHPVPLDPASWTVLQRWDHRQAWRTDTPHVVVSKGTKAGRNPASTAYLSHVLDDCGFPSRMIRSTRLVAMVHTRDPKLVAAAFGMDPQATLICLADPVDEGRLRFRDPSACLTKEQAARQFFFNDPDQPVEGGRATSGTSFRQPGGHVVLVRRVTAGEPHLDLTGSLVVSKVLARDFVVAPLDHEVAVVWSPEAAAEAVSEGIEVPAEVAAASDALADDPPEVLQRLDLTAVQHVSHRHSPQAMSRRAAR
ncbi:hypothetical protein GCM10017562_02390 [Streptomyces roseofulvus]